MECVKSLTTAVIWITFYIGKGTHELLYFVNKFSSTYLIETNLSNFRISIQFWFMSLCVYLKECSWTVMTNMRPTVWVAMYVGWWESILCTYNEMTFDIAQQGRRLELKDEISSLLPILCAMQFIKDLYILIFLRNSFNSALLPIFHCCHCCQFFTPEWQKEEPTYQ